MFSLNKQQFLDSFTNKEISFDLEQLKVYSRIPIYNKDIDDIIGVVISKEYFYERIET